MCSLNYASPVTYYRFFLVLKKHLKVTFLWMEFGVSQTGVVSGLVNLPQPLHPSHPPHACGLLTAC